MKEIFLKNIGYFLLLSDPPSCTIGQFVVLHINYGVIKLQEYQL